MKNQKFLIGFIAVLMLSLTSVAALTPSVTTTFNDVLLTETGMTMAGMVGDVVPVRVSFTANTDATDVRVKVWLEGYRTDVSAQTSRFDLVSGSTYSQLLSLRLPSDLKDLTKEYKLHVGIVTANDDVYKEYQLKLQRESYNFDVLSVDYDTTVSAGDTVPVAVVIENTGMQDLEDGYVIVSISELGISAKGYFGDLASIEECSDGCDNGVDSLQRIVYLRIPENAVAGVYELNTKVYNREVTVSANSLIRVDASASTTVLAAVKNQDMKAGETKTYDLLIVNSDSKVKVYRLSAVSGTALSVSVPSVITVGPDSSLTVPITVTASPTADVGSYTFTVDVNGQQVVLGANVTSGRVVSNSVIALTVALVIIFVVLLIVLIVLLTRKEKPIEEVETSYY